MAKVRLPRYFRARKLADGTLAYFWERPSWSQPPAERNGRRCPVDSEPLGTDLPAAIARADMLNAALDEWRIGIHAPRAEGTVRWLFAWYRTLDRFKQLSFKSRRDYVAYMNQLEAFPLKSSLLGDRRAAEIRAEHVDKIYAALMTPGRLGKPRKRAASYAMTVCRRVWAEGVRHRKVKDNPFAAMGLKVTPEKGNRATSRAEYDLFRATAREMGFQSMATAAAISFELVRRKTDVFGFDFDNEGEDAAGFFWEGYAPGVMFSMRQGKTKIDQTIPLRGDPVVDAEGRVIGEGPLLYPELEEELARTGRRASGHIVLNEDTGQRYTEDQADRRFREIREKAGLPKAMTFTGFRHGGATELGDAGIEDIRPVSGHRTLQQTTVYNKANELKARKAGVKRRAHVVETTPLKR